MSDLDDIFGIEIDDNNINDTKLMNKTTIKIDDDFDDIFGDDNNIIINNPNTNNINNNINNESDDFDLDELDSVLSNVLDNSTSSLLNNSNINNNNKNKNTADDVLNWLKDDNITNNTNNTNKNEDQNDFLSWLDNDTNDDLILSTTTASNNNNNNIENKRNSFNIDELEKELFQNDNNFIINNNNSDDDDDDSDDDSDDDLSDLDHLENNPLIMASRINIKKNIKPPLSNNNSNSNNINNKKINNISIIPPKKLEIKLKLPNELKKILLSENKLNEKLAFNLSELNNENNFKKYRLHLWSHHLQSKSLPINKNATDITELLMWAKDENFIDWTNDFSLDNQNIIHEDCKYGAEEIINILNNNNNENKDDINEKIIHLTYRIERIVTYYFKMHPNIIYHVSITRLTSLLFWICEGSNNLINKENNNINDNDELKNENNKLLINDDSMLLSALNWLTIKYFRFLKLDPLRQSLYYSLLVSEFRLLLLFHSPLLTQVLDRNLTHWEKSHPHRQYIDNIENKGRKRSSSWSKQDDDVDNDDDDDVDDDDDENKNNKDNNDNENKNKIKNQPQEIIPVDWFCCNFIASLPFKILARLWDFIIFFDDPYFSLYYTLSFFLESSDNIITTSSDELPEQIRNLTFTTFLDKKSILFSTLDNNIDSTALTRMEMCLKKSFELRDISTLSFKEHLTALIQTTTKIKERMIQFNKREKKLDQQNQIKNNVNNIISGTASIFSSTIKTISKISQTSPMQQNRKQQQHNQQLQGQNQQKEIPQQTSITKQQQQQQQQKKKTSPFTLLPKHICMTLSAWEVIPSLLISKNTLNNNNNMNNINENNIFSFGNLPFFLIDCRPSVFKTLGSFPTSFHIELKKLFEDPEEMDKLISSIAQMNGSVGVCLMGIGREIGLGMQVGNQTKQETFDSYQQHVSAIQACALALIKKGTPYIGLMRGGFSSALRVLIEGTEKKQFNNNNNINMNTSSFLTTGTYGETLKSPEISINSLIDVDLNLLGYAIKILAPKSPLPSLLIKNDNNTNNINRIDYINNMKSIKTKASSLFSAAASTLSGSLNTYQQQNNNINNNSNNSNNNNRNNTNKIGPTLDPLPPKMPSPNTDKNKNIFKEINNNNNHELINDEIIPTNDDINNNDNIDKNNLQDISNMVKSSLFSFGQTIGKKREIFKQQFQQFQKDQQDKKEKRRNSENEKNISKKLERTEKEKEFALAHHKLNGLKEGDKIIISEENFPGAMLFPAWIKELLSIKEIERLKKLSTENNNNNNNNEEEAEKKKIEQEGNENEQENMKNEEDNKIENENNNYNEENDDENKNNEELEDKKKLAWIPCLLAITKERLIVLEANGGINSTAIVKSNNHLTELSKVTFKKKNPQIVTLFFRSNILNDNDNNNDDISLNKKIYKVPRKDEFITLLQKNLEYFK